MTTQADPNLRTGSAPYERVTNAYQKRLVSAYDAWARDTRQLMLGAADRGATPRQITGILNARMGILNNSLGTAGRNGIAAAVRVSVGRNTARTSTIVQRVMQQLIAQHIASVAGTLTPGIQQQLARNVQRANVINRNTLAEIFANQRYRVANYAGGAWAGIFEAQRQVGLATGEQRRIMWELNELAEHCQPSPGFAGCPELAGIYESWDALPTVPAGQVTCRGNCRCSLLVEDDNGNWVRGFSG